MDNVIILCAGTGSRAALGYNKIFHPLADGSVLSEVISRFNGFERVILAVAKDDLEKITEIYSGNPSILVVGGGRTRTESVRNALNALKKELDGGKSKNSCEIVAIHDGARPFVTREIISDAMESAVKTGSGIPAVRTVDSVAMAENGKIVNNIDRNTLFSLQTPQCFRFSEIFDAYSRIKGDYADDSEVYRLAGYSPALTEGSYLNKKLTTAEDFKRLEEYSPTVLAAKSLESATFVGGASDNFAIGSGFDVHPLVSGRRLILGGVDIPHDKGLDGHSDADVLAHALTDAILSAAAQPDIGVLFPDNSPAFKGIDSLLLLDRALQLLQESGKRIISVSCVLIAQQPKLSPFIPEIRANLARRMGIEMSRINISATTTEFLGIVGEGKAIAAAVTALFSKN